MVWARLAAHFAHPLRLHASSGFPVRGRHAEAAPVEAESSKHREQQGNRNNDINAMIIARWPRRKLKRKT